MAACAAACQLQRNRILASIVFANDAVLGLSAGLCRLCGLAPGTRARDSCSFWKKRKLARSANIAVVKQSQHCPLSISSRGVEGKVNQPSVAKPHVSLENLSHTSGLSYLLDDSVITSCFTDSSKTDRDRSRDGSNQGAVGVPSWSNAKLNTLTTSSTSFRSPQNSEQHHFVRHFSSRQGDNGEEEKTPKPLRNAVSVMYITNPITWVANKWNTANLRRNYDPSFSESEFLLGARQAVSHVTNLVSQGRFDRLKELISVEAMEWLTCYRESLCGQEKEALALDVDNLAVMKIVLVELDTEEDQKLAYVDLACIGLKVVDNTVPYMVDMGVRFQRDYSTEPPSGWVVDKVRHIHLNNMAL